jgi:adenylate cyclase
MQKNMGKEVMMYGTHGDPSEFWMDISKHGYPGPIKWAHTFFRRIPRGPRCKYCYSPFFGIGGFFMRKMFDRAPSLYNPQICNVCDRYMQKHPGGAEVKMAVLFADIRGSTALAEKLGNIEFSRLIDRFYQVATDVLANRDAFIEKIIGDEVTGLFFPSLNGGCYIESAITAARQLLEATGHKDPNGPWAPTCRESILRYCWVAKWNEYRNRFRGYP